MTQNEKHNTQAVLSVLAYYQIFKHPLTAMEIAEFSGVCVVHVEKTLTELTQLHILECNQGYYGISNIEANVIRRKEANTLAKKIMPRAIKRGEFILSFPFVKMVFISGSLSKGVMYPDGDVDYFVVTQPGRLWIARTLLMLYKKVFLLNSRKLFCINYFVSANALNIEEKNLFTATELITAIPIRHEGWTEKLLHRNKWVSQFYPGKVSNTELENCTIAESDANEITHSLLDRMDSKLMYAHRLLWRRKFQTMETSDFQLALKSTKSVSKHHPSNYQKKVLNQYEELLEQLTKKLQEYDYASVV